MRLSVGMNFESKIAESESYPEHCLLVLIQPSFDLAKQGARQGESEELFSENCEQPKKYVRNL